VCPWVLEEEHVHELNCSKEESCIIIFFWKVNYVFVCSSAAFIVYSIVFFSEVFMFISVFVMSSEF